MRPPLLSTYGAISRLGNALVGNSIYFVLEGANRILEYDMGRQKPVMITIPFVRNEITLMTAEDGGLGYSTMEDFKLCLWSRKPGAAQSHRSQKFPPSFCHLNLA